MITIPTRIQRSRAKGSTTPENTKYCGRPGKWGNPFVVSQAIKTPDRFVVYAVATNANLVQVYDDLLYMHGPCVFDTKREAQAHAALLFGELMDAAPGQYRVHALTKFNHLSCWCKVGEPCHVDEIIKRIQSSK